MMTRKACIARRVKGVTLTELLITLVIVGILSSIAVPSYNSFVAGRRIKIASFDLLSMLMLARSEAIKRGAQVAATPVNGDWSRGWTITTDTGVVLSQQSALPGIIITCLQGNPPVAATCGNVFFNADGRSGRTQFIQVGSANTDIQSRCIGIDLSGRPNSKKGDC
ncbi:MAG: GspH/FimT family pseudopilin [Gallionella sp.]|nr:GspH/FimT family pseudopilin [Gallionella sp.]